MNLIDALSTLYETDPFPSPIAFSLLVRSLPTWAAKLDAIAREKLLKWNLDPALIEVEDLVAYAEAHFWRQVTVRHTSRQDRGFFFGPADSRAYRNGKLVKVAEQGMHRGVRSRIGKGSAASSLSDHMIDPPDPRGGLPEWLLDLPEPHQTVIELYLLGIYRCRDQKDEISDDNQEDEILGLLAARAGVTIARLIKNTWVASFRFLVDHSPDASSDQVSDLKALADSLEELGDRWTMAFATRTAADRRGKSVEDLRASIEDLF